MTQKSKLLAVISAGIIFTGGFNIYDLSVQNNDLRTIINDQIEINNEKDTVIEDLNKRLKTMEDNLQERNQEIEELKESGHRHGATLVNYNNTYGGDVRRVKVTAYSQNDGMTPGSIMANGEHVAVGYVAYNDAPLGSVVIIDGVRYIVGDRVGSDGVVDIYMNSVAECNEFGVKYKDITVIRPSEL